MSEKPVLITGRDFIRRLIAEGIIKEDPNISSVTIEADCGDVLHMTIRFVADHRLGQGGILHKGEAKVIRPQ